MRLASYLIAASLLAACGIEDSGVEDGEGDVFTAADGKADGYDLSEAQALAVMRVAGSATAAQLQETGLGYFGSNAMVSIRTANETAAVLRALEAP